MEVHLSLTTWAVVTTVSQHQRLLPKTISFLKSLTVVAVYHVVNKHMVIGIIDILSVTATIGNGRPPLPLVIFLHVVFQLRLKE